ncbi:preprotein translocase subunit SecG [Alcaligenaceae bacterium]|nr:preprotein translocase subunit SecG [Alcaligenaceae bacterium]
MEWLSPALMAVQVISSLSVIVLVLLQQGKGADMGSAFGSGSAGSLFGAAGAANFLSRTTKWAAILFFASTAGLAWLSHKPQGVIDAGVMQGFEVPQVPGSAPAAPNGAVPSVPSAPGAASVPDASVPQAAEPAAQGGESVPALSAPAPEAEAPADGQPASGESTDR